MLIFRLYVAASIISVVFVIVTLTVLIYSSVKRDRLLTRNNGTVSSLHHRFVIYLRRVKLVAARGSRQSSGMTN